MKKNFLSGLSSHPSGQFLLLKVLIIIQYGGWVLQAEMVLRTGTVELTPEPA
jgi:hypothetical protein